MSNATLHSNGYDLRNTYTAATNAAPPPPPPHGPQSNLGQNGNARQIQQGPYLNVPYPPRTQTQQVQPQATSAMNGNGNSLPSTQPPPPFVDLSANRDQRGSAFELYRKPHPSSNAVYA